tara:strand:+ start:227 stop:478 length:252 start_codon:yes stop_codon:yes gene_type:complete
MELKSLAANRTLLIFNRGITEILFSYETPVAGYSDKLGYIRTDKYYSQTTARHINKYLGNTKHTVVSQSVIDDLIKEQIPDRY